MNQYEAIHFVKILDKILKTDDANGTYWFSTSQEYREEFEHSHQSKNAH